MLVKKVFLSFYDSLLENVLKTLDPCLWVKEALDEDHHEGAAEIYKACEALGWFISYYVQVLEKMGWKLKEEMINFNLVVMMHVQEVEMVIFLDEET